MHEIFKLISKVCEAIKEKFTFTEKIPKKPEYEVIKKSVCRETFMRSRCVACFKLSERGNGVILECSHPICKLCIPGIINPPPYFKIKCPYYDCGKLISDDAIRDLESYMEYQRHLEQKLATVEISKYDYYHCKKRSCIGWVVITNKKVKNFKCEVCKRINCIKCEIIHDGISCKESREQRKKQTKMTNQMIKMMIKNKLVMKCPKCGAFIEKNGGCDLVKCSQCKENFQWYKVKEPKNGFRKKVWRKFKRFFQKKSK